jgi:hypothetical protein
MNLPTDAVTECFDLDNKGTGSCAIISSKKQSIVAEIIKHIEQFFVRNMLH